MKYSTLTAVALAQGLVLAVAFYLVGGVLQGQLMDQVRTVSRALECTPCPQCAPLANATSGPMDHFRYPSYLRQPGFLSPEEADWLIKNVGQRYSYGPGYVGVAGGKVEVRAKKRLASHADVPKTDPDFRWVLERALNFVGRKNRQYWRYPIPHSVDSPLVENMMFITYNGTERGHYDWHMDSGVFAAIARRKLSIVVILSPEDSYTGGDLLLQPGDKVLRMDRQQGALFVFPSFVFHKVEPVTSGIRHSIVMQVGSW